MSSLFKYFIIEPVSDFNTNANRSSNLLDGIVDIISDSDKEFIPPLSKRRGLDRYINEVISSRLYLCTYLGVVIAFANMVKKDGKEFGLPNIEIDYIHTIIVKKDFRKESVAQDIVRLIRRDPTNKYKTLYARTWSTNKSSQGLFLGCGFTITETIENDRGNGIHTVLMESTA